MLWNRKRPRTIFALNCHHLWMLVRLASLSTPCRRPRISLAALHVHCDRASSTQLRRYSRFSLLENVENLESYAGDGHRPSRIGDTPSNGRYTILHKLGFGGSSTVWLARDHHGSEQSQDVDAAPGSLVTLKIMSASMSRRPPSELPEISIPRYLSERIPLSEAEAFQLVQNSFMEPSPNGQHLCIVTPFRGPSILALKEHLRARYNCRLRGNLARRIAKQAAMGLKALHNAGVRLADFTTSNLLLALNPRTAQWTDDQVYAHLGDPVTEDVDFDADFSGLSQNQIPGELIEAASFDGISSELTFSPVISDFGQSFLSANGLPEDLQPATVTHYRPPEMRFEGKVGAESDIWMLASTIS
ncbi:hypothetical protein NMY22_g11900 [Coprinellus aureogranulatus]|nr:hypothetical protein NMY22_g11900 [Coprinellus aureogranulatus]